MSVPPCESAKICVLVIQFTCAILNGFTVIHYDALMWSPCNKEIFQNTNKEIFQDYLTRRSFRTILQGDISGLSYKEIFQDYLTRRYFRTILQGDISGLSYKEIFQDYLTRRYFRTILQGDISGLSYKEIFQNTIVILDVHLFEPQYGNHS